jgi:hypothetical protein
LENLNKRESAAVAASSATNTPERAELMEKTAEVKAGCGK